MNGESGRGLQLEMRWCSIVVADQPKRHCPQLAMKWISIASPHLPMNI
jgi:hypothetical protein